MINSNNQSQIIIIPGYNDLLLAKFPGKYYRIDKKLEGNKIRFSGYHYIILLSPILKKLILTI
jgi:hypothetical protein